MGFTGMEAGVLSAYHARYASQGFPAPDQVQFLSREETGGGKYIKISSSSLVEVPDGYLYLPDCFIELDDLDDGMSPVVIIKNRRLDTLEFIVNGEQDWGGGEGGWKLVC